MGARYVSALMDVMVMVMGMTQRFGKKETGKELAKMRPGELGELVMVCPNSITQLTNETLVSKHT